MELLILHLTCSVIHDWARNIDKNKQTDIFILDFEKVFDTVPREQLKANLYRYGITGKPLVWIDPVVQSSGSVLLSIVCWKKCVIIGVNSFDSSFNIFGLISSGPRE
jgi:hypothetical protein